MRLVQTSEHRPSMVNIILALPQFKIDYIDGINLSNPVIGIALPYIYGNGFRHAIEHPVEIGNLVIVLYFHYYQFTVLVFRQHVHTVELVERILLVAFAFQKVLNGYLSAYQ